MSVNERGCNFMKKQILSFPVLFTLLMCGVMLALFLTGPSSVQAGAASGSIPESTWSEPEYPININTATEEELAFLPGIGPALAGRITAYRQEYGVFAAPEELMLVSGIGQNLFAELLPYITTGG